MRREMGVLLIFAGLALLMISSALSGGGEFGGVILIGPIPIVIGSSPGMALISMGMALVLTITAFILFRRQG